MQITGHGISRATLSEFTSATDAFFALDAAAKARYRCPPGINRGYTPPRAESLASSLGLATAADLFEAVNVGTSAADFPGLDLPPGRLRGERLPGARSRLRGRRHRLVRGGRPGGPDDGADLRRGPRRPRGLLRRVHRPLDRRAADEQLPAAGPRRRARAGPARHGGAHRLRHRDRAVGRPGARPGDPRRRRELAPGHAGRRRPAGQPGRRDRPLDERGVDLHPAPRRRPAARRRPGAAAECRLLPRRQRGRGDRAACRAVSPPSIRPATSR